LFKFSFDINILPLYIFFAANVPFILEIGIPFIGHYWSLGVEEQFYMFWPWMVSKIKYVFFFTFVSVIVILSAKILLHIFYPNSLLESIIHVSRFHCMMIGALGAMLFHNKHLLFFKIIDNKMTQGFCWGIIFLVAINKFHIISFLDNEFISIIALFIIVGQIREKNRVVNLEKGYFDFLGKISYGIYVIHPLIIFFFSNLFKGIDINMHSKYFLVYFSIISVTILFSHLSYKYFEKLFLNLKKHYLVVKSVASLRY
jgi:peptidoglycan/LPS O-acetylase OafA/YrhL